MPPYSDAGREIFKDRFQQQCGLDRSVNTCALSGDGVAGEGGNLEVAKSEERDFPLPLQPQCRDFAWMDWVPALPFGNPESEYVTTNVEMVADEVFCWLRRIARARREAVPLLRLMPPNTGCFIRDSRAAGCALLQKEYSDDV